MKMTNKGYSLIELILYLLIASILLTANVAALSNILKVRTETLEQQQLNFALNNIGLSMTQDLRWAESVDILDSGATVEMANGATIIRYFLSDGTIVKEVDDVEYIMTPDDIDILALSFQNVAPVNIEPSINITIQAQGVFSDNPLVVTNTLTISKREQQSVVPTPTP